MRAPYLIAAVLAAAQVFSASAEATGNRGAATRLNSSWRIASASYNGQRVRVTSRIDSQNSRFPKCPYSPRYAPSLLLVSVANMNLRVLQDGHSLVAGTLGGKRLWTRDVFDFDQPPPIPPAPGYRLAPSPWPKICPVINSLYVEKAPDYIRLGQVRGGYGENYVVWIYTSSGTAWEIGLRNGALLESARN